ncbi:MAG: flagellar M-ring protein FliF [Desulfobacteraceae bacterium]|nr:MAG: flagellar M-ring protein FliF [Desulfobacteraceae bacterium]
MAETGKETIRQFLQVLRSIPTGRKISLAVSTAVVVAGFVILLLWVNKPDYQVLFANLETADASRITQKLSEKKTPYQLKEGGSAILVPSDMVYQLRLEMAGDGLPRGQNIGFEIFNDMPFGTTEFVQRLKYKQALQGELARTIMGFDSVAQARVHIVPAGDSLFAEEERPATASVVLRLHGGRSLDSRQLQGIVNLVARAVEGLKPDNVTVVDMSGGLLSKGSEEDHATAMSKTQFDHQQKLERTLQNRIQTMLEPVVGANKVVARVSAQVDFERVNLVEEMYDPDKFVVRSEQRQKESSSRGKGTAAGSPDLQTQVYQTQSSAASLDAKGYEKENSTVNYEINKVSRQVTNAVGEVKRLSAAVIIDGPYVQEKGSDGKPVSKFIARNKKDMKVFEDIVKKAIGFNESRGDQVSVSNIPFVPQEEERAGSDVLPWWMDYGKKATKPVFNLLLVCLFLLLTVKPFRRWIQQTGQTLNQTAALPQGHTAGSLPAQAGGDGHGEKTETSNLLEISKGNPEAVAHIIRQWISEGR